MKGYLTNSKFAGPGNDNVNVRNILNRIETAQSNVTDAEMNPPTDDFHYIYRGHYSENPSGTVIDWYRVEDEDRAKTLCTRPSWTYVSNPEATFSSPFDDGSWEVIPEGYLNAGFEKFVPKS